MKGNNLGDTGLSEDEIKQALSEKFERQERGGKAQKPHRKHGTNYTPPKKRHRKK